MALSARQGKSARLGLEAGLGFVLDPMALGLGLSLEGGGEGAGLGLQLSLAEAISGNFALELELGLGLSVESVLPLAASLLPAELGFSLLWRDSGWEAGMGWLARGGTFLPRLSAGYRVAVASLP
jgi:hypothetical protein